MKIKWGYQYQSFKIDDAVNMEAEEARECEQNV
jgi:hypothetical protein